jgi:hypothetical protein
MWDVHRRKLAMDTSSREPVGPTRCSGRAQRRGVVLPRPPSPRRSTRLLPPVSGPVVHQAVISSREANRRPERRLVNCIGRSPARRLARQRRQLATEGKKRRRRSRSSMAVFSWPSSHSKARCLIDNPLDRSRGCAGCSRQPVTCSPASPAWAACRQRLCSPEAETLT